MAGSACGSSPLIILHSSLFTLKYLILPDASHITLFHHMITSALTHAPLGYLAERALTRECVAVAKWARREMKALDEYFLSKLKKS